MLKLRARYTKNCIPFNDDIETERFPGMDIINSYKVPLRLDDKDSKGHVILLKGPQNSNTLNNSWTGLNMVRANLLRDKEFEQRLLFSTIEVEEWN